MGVTDVTGLGNWRNGYSSSETLPASSGHTNVIYRWTPDGTVEVFRSKSGYAGVDMGEYTQPGSNGLTFDAQGRLTICQQATGALSASSRVAI